MTTMRLTPRANYPTITIATPTAWVDTTASIPFNLATNKVVITSTSLDSNPQIFLGASIAASAQAAVQSDCPEVNSPSCQSSIQSALNPGNALVIQARVVPLLIGAAALTALLSIVIGYFELTDASVRAQVIELQPGVYTSLASAQYSASVVFFTASDDSFPVTVSMGGAGAMIGATTGGSVTATGASVPATSSIHFSTATTNANGLTSGEIVFPLPTDEALAIASILAVSAVADSCAPMSTGSLQKRGVYDWGSVVNSANDLWPAVEPGGELQLIRTVVDMQLPPLLIVVQVTLQQVVAAGAQIAGMALSAGGLGIVAAVLFFIALDLKYCLNPNPNTFVIPTEAIANSAASISQASGTTLDCPPPTAAPDCSNCGGNDGSSQCLGIHTATMLWLGCDCYDPPLYGDPGPSEQQILELLALQFQLDAQTFAPNTTTAVPHATSSAFLALSTTASSGSSRTCTIGCGSELPAVCYYSLSLQRRPETLLQQDMTEKRKDLTYRVRGIPYGVEIIALGKGLQVILESQDVNVDSLAQSSIRREGQVATIRVANSAKLSDPRDEWRIPAGRALAVDADDKSEPVLAIDAHFLGFTPLYSPTRDVEDNSDCIAISGLGSHAFGSWKDRESHYMWLRDALPHELPGTRVLTYGYDTRLAGSHSFQNLEDVALKFRRSLKIALGDRPSNRPLIFIAHSLGGLVLKQALIQMASGSVEDVSIFYSTYGILFFGVPNQGMDISSLLAMVGSQPNLPFLTMLSKDAGILQELIEKFRTVFEFKDSEIISFYETHASRTARNDGTGKWSMSGDHAVLVDRFSARSGRPWEENHSFLQPIGRNHSDMVKYSEYDDDVGIVCDFLTRLAKPAPLVIRDRIKRLESVTTSAPPNARSLASRPQPQGKQAAIEQQKIPIAAKQRTEKLARSTGNQSKEKERSNHGQHEGDSNTIIEKTKMPGPSEPRISENKEYEKMLTSEGFDTGTEPSRKDGLLWAARTGHVLLTEYLLDRDTSIEAKDPEGWTPLHWAAFTANLELFHRLLFQGAMFHARTNDGETLLHLASYYNERHPKISHIEHYIGSSSDREAIALELLDRGLFVDEQDKSGGTPLLFAAACGLENMIELLASKGADVQATGVKRSSALHYASRCNRLGAVDVLLNEGTNPLSLDEQGKSPLDLALFYGHEEVAKRLKGARLDAR